MMVLVKVIWHLFKLCAIGLALTVPGSRGFSVFPFKEPFSSFVPVEEQEHGYIFSAVQFSKGLAVQPPLASSPFESSPPGPEDIQSFPHQPPSMVSPTQSYTSPPMVEPPAPDVSVQSSVPTPPEFFAPPLPEAALHDLAPPPVVAPLHVHARQPPAVPPHNSPPLLHALAPYASASPQTSVPSRVFPSSPPVSPPVSATKSPVTTSHDSAPSAAHPSPSVSSSSPAVVRLNSSAAQPPSWPEHTSPPSIVAMPSHTSAQKPPAVSPHVFPSSPHASTASIRVKTLHHLVSPLPVPHHHLASSPSFMPPKATSSFPPVTALGHSAPPLYTTVLPHDSTPSSAAAPHVLLTPSSPMESHSTPVPPLAPHHNLAPSAPPIMKHTLTTPPALSFHSSTPLPTVAPHEPAPYPTIGPPRDLGNLTPPLQSHSSAPPPPAVPSHDSASFPPTVPPTFATPISHVPPHSLAPPPQAMPPDVSVPPHPSATPPITVPSHVLVPPPAVKPHFSAPPPFYMPYISAPPPNSTISGHVSSLPPSTSAIHVSGPPPNQVPSNVSLPLPAHAPFHIASPHSAKPHFLAPPPSSVHNVSAPLSNSTASMNASYPPSVSVLPHASAPSTAAEPPFTSSSPSIHPGMPGSLAPLSYQRKKPKYQSSVPSVAPSVTVPSINPVVPGETPSVAPETHVPQASSPTPSFDRRGDRIPVAIAPSSPKYTLSPTNHQPLRKGFSPYIAPSAHNSKGLSNLAPAPATSPPKSPTEEVIHGPSSSPVPSVDKARHQRDSSHSAPETSYAIPSPAPKRHGQVENPYSLLAPTPESRERYHSPTHHNPGPSAAMVPSNSPLAEDYITPVPMSVLPVPSSHSMSPFLSPRISPSGSLTRKPNRQLPRPILALPPPPPNQDCSSTTCMDPLTNRISGSPCGCVYPMKVELLIGVALYTFFPLVPEFAHEIANGIFIKPNQVRIMGANAASEQPEKTLVMIDLVPLGDKFDNITAFVIYERFWNKKVAINKSLFGDYEVLYVQYPGLPPPPPTASDIATTNGGQDNGSKVHPLGVDVTKQGHRHRLGGSLIAIIVSSATGVVLLCLSLGLILLCRRRRHLNHSAQALHVYPASIARSTGLPGQSVGSGLSSSLSFESSVAAYTGSAKTFSATEIEKATDNFNPSRVLGEGGFGRVYSGILEDGTQVAVKVLKRDDQQGGREFLAEVEMLSRLHHRNLVKLIGICVDERVRCLIYQLIPNGSVESHLHGIDKDTSPLDWAVRMKIALGAARGLAYLHEDSSPRVIHRDFKASNILLEPDFTPKVSDFGLARIAMDEENRHISTRVMGTFGYVAPEYAMTGHLLVKSDVYSYGVVLLELLTGKKPVDMTQPPGQENLVAWTRPFLTNKEALRSIVDPNLGQDISFDSVAKVAAIASMCVQPEVSHRPFMGEVVQALKLVCNECDDIKDEVEESPKICSHENETRNPLQSRCSVHSYFSSGGNGDDLEKGLSASDTFSMREAGLEGTQGRESGIFYRHSSSGPIGGRRAWRFWRRGRRTSGHDEHGMYRFWSGSH